MTQTAEHTNKKLVVQIRDPHLYKVKFCYDFSYYNFCAKESQCCHAHGCKELRGETESFDEFLERHSEQNPEVEFRVDAKDRRKLETAVVRKDADL